MENRINIAELLKDCPKGMELDCTTYENLYFDYVREHAIYPIVCYTVNNKGEKISIVFNWYGKHTPGDTAKCVIFPKGKTTWDGFHRPFVDGDIVTCTNEYCTYIAIFKEMKDNNSFYRHAVTYDNEFCCVNNDWSDFNETCRFATEEEKEKLFDAIKANGYKWNEDTKTLEKLPKFKVRDRIEYINGKNKNGVKEGIILSITNDTYDVAVTNDMGIFVPISEQDEWELVPNKFDITTLKPFDSRVLVREGKTDVWQPTFYGFFHKRNKRFYTTMCGTWRMCIPYNEDTKHLTGTTDDCDEYYKNW